MKKYLAIFDFDYTVVDDNTDTWGASEVLNFAARCQNYPKLHVHEVAPFNFKIMKQSRRNSRILK